LALTITEHETTEFHTLLVVVIGRDLIEPKTHILVVVFGFLSIGHILFSFVADFLSQWVFRLEPAVSATTIGIVLVFIVPITFTLVVHLIWWSVSALGSFI